MPYTYTVQCDLSNTTILVHGANDIRDALRALITLNDPAINHAPALTVQVQQVRTTGRRWTMVDGAGHSRVISDEQTEEETE